MNPTQWWERRAGCAKALLAGCFQSGMGPLERMEPRMEAALGDVLARPGSLGRAVASYLLGIEMGMAEGSARAIACGIEYLHTASLVFDDLPSMDDARMRRGAPALHVAHGEGVAVLTALALVNRGYAMLWQGISPATDQRREMAGDWVDRCLGGMIGGQAFDIRGWRGDQSAAEVSEVAARKTGDLLRLTLVLPAIVGRGTAREIQLLDRLALLRGLAYQAADDVKDVLGGETGKTSGRDQEMGRPNMVMAEGLGPAMARVGRLLKVGDRVQEVLPGPVERWGMLNNLRVSMPTCVEGMELSFVSAAI
jgi:geranylgeranyl pyrophosphate synthase